MRFRCFLIFGSLAYSALCIQLKYFTLEKSTEGINRERHGILRSSNNLVKRDIGKKVFFLNILKGYQNAHFNKTKVRNKKNEKEEEICSTFDEYFNKKAEENYTKLEAEKLKILKDNINLYKGEIRKVLEKSYKNEYEKLVEEDEEDEKVSKEVYENLKITFLMKENINNFLFTQYSYMINKLKERSVIMKNLRKFYSRGGGSGEGSAKDSDEGSAEDSGEGSAEDSGEDSAEDSGEDSAEDSGEGNGEEKDDLETAQGGNKASAKDKADKLSTLFESVNFFKPKESYGQARECKTFSDQMFANAKIENANLLLNEKEEKERITNDELISNCEEEEKELFLQNNVSTLQLFKENVKDFLHYKKENIIKSNLNEDLLYGRVKVHWFPKFMNRVITKIPDYIKVSDIIIEVRNGIIPFVFDDLYALNMFDIYTNKPKIIVYTNCDRSSLKGNDEWGSYYRRKLYWYDKNFNKNINKEYMKNQMKKSAVIFVDAKNGKKEIIILKKLINRLCEDIIESKKRKGLYNYKVKCIFLGLPNVGKSALINRILEIKKTKSYDYPGLTTTIQMYSTKKYELIDTPGILAQNLYKLREKDYNKNNMILDKIYNSNPRDYSVDNVVHIKNYRNYMHIENNIYLLALCNHISPKMYDIYNIAEVLVQNLHNAYLYDNDYVDLKKIIKRYEIDFTQCLNCEGNFSAYHFIQRLARDRFRNDLNQASMRLVTDFRKNYLGRMTLNYPIYFNKKAVTLKVSKQFEKQPEDKYVGW
ncbi:ribosome biogenesis GTPase A, putative (RbgA) [Plasmodium ovale wallikeri]|uniref:Ribosome biogenesis GTPase A, putative (RbgA) n=1 Tax=Plasmodium ovale wallikeri TaxID=864142 RepID=A0A1A8YIP5_PLAOA|nr:ribosome biogenesis GTPase A, putative (RbgA) [Plasmodium ovale wallikeri]